MVKLTKHSSGAGRAYLLGVASEVAGFYFRLVFFQLCQSVSYLFITKFHFELTLRDINLDYIAYARRFEGIGIFGISATALSMGEQEVINENEEATGEMYDASSYALQVSFARQLTSQFSFGVSFKYVGEQIYREKSNGFAFDFGTMLYTGFRSLRLAMNISNIGPELTFDGPDLDVAYDSDHGGSTVKGFPEASLPIGDAFLNRAADRVDYHELAALDSGLDIEAFDLR